MKNLLLATVGVIAMTGVALAGGATMDSKGTNSQGSNIGVASSRVTGNGDWVGGNGTGTGFLGASDQTTYPGSRSDAVQGAFGGAGPGNSSNHSERSER